MAFSLLSAIGGAAEVYTDKVAEARKYALEQMRETSSRIQERFDTEMANRMKQKSEYEQIGKELTGLGLSEDQALVIMQQGVEQARDIAGRAKLAQQALPNYSINDIVTLSDPQATGMSMAEGIDNLIGIASATPMGGGLTFDSRGMQSQWEQTKSNLEQQYGMSYDQLRNIAYGNVERGALPSGTVSTVGLYEPEVLQIRQAQQQIRKGELDIASAEIGMETLRETNQTKLGLLQEELAQQKFTTENLEEAKQQADEEHKLRIETGKVDLRSKRVDLLYQGDLLRADLRYKLAQAKAEEADAAGEDLLKLNDVRALYKDSINDSLSKTFPGQFNYNIETGKTEWLGNEEGKASFDKEVRRLQLNWLNTMKEQYALTPAVVSTFSSFAGVPLTVMPDAASTSMAYTLDELKEMGAGTVKDFKKGKIFADTAGQFWAVQPYGAQNEYKFVPLNRSTYWK